MKNQAAPVGFLLLEKAAVAAFGDSELALGAVPFVCAVAALLLFALRKKLARLEMAGLPQTVFTLVGAAAVAGAVGFGLYHFWDARLGHANLAVKFGAVFVPAALAGAVYWLLAMWAKVPAAKEMSSLIGQRGRRRK